MSSQSFQSFASFATAVDVSGTHSNSRTRSGRGEIGKPHSTCACKYGIDLCASDSSLLVRKKQLYRQRLGWGTFSACEGQQSIANLNARSLARSCISQLTEASALNSASKSSPINDEAVCREVQINSELKDPLREALRGVSHVLNSHFEDPELSAYDTAWVAKIPARNSNKSSESAPHFPQALQWIVTNQRSNGSWRKLSGSSNFDDALSTLACIVALSTWRTAEIVIKKGKLFLERSLSVLTEEDLLYVSVGLKHAFAALLEEARDLGLLLLVSNPLVEDLCTQQNTFLKRLTTVDRLKECPRKLLSFPEGLHKVLDWDKVRELQSPGGSLFFSPAATACFVIKTGDEKGLEYLSSILLRCNAVPTVYPAQVLDNLQLVEHLERLNIDHYFHSEIEGFLRFLKGYKIDTRNNLETLATIFRALREHQLGAHSASYLLEGIFNWEVDKLDIQGLLQLYRSSELMFRDEILLDHIKELTTDALSSRMAQKEDKSSVKEHVSEFLSFPSFLRLLPLESLKYIGQFDGDETFLESSFSRFLHASNPALVAYAKRAFNTRQRVFQNELADLQRWYKDCRLDELTFARQSLGPCFITAAAGTPDLEMGYSRAVWTYGAVLTTVIDDLFDEHGSIEELRIFAESVRKWDFSVVAECSEPVRICASAIYRTVDEMVQKAVVSQGRNLEPFFQKVWRSLMETFLMEAEWRVSKYEPSLEEYFKTADISFAVEPISLFAALFRGEVFLDADLEHEEYWELSATINRLGRVLNDTRTHSREKLVGKTTSISVYARQHPGVTEEEALEVLVSMQMEFAQSLLCRTLSPNSPVPRSMRQTHLSMMRALYLMYFTGDGYRFLTDEFKQKMKGFLTHPFPL